MQEFVFGKQLTNFIYFREERFQQAGCIIPLN